MSKKQLNKNEFLRILKRKLRKLKPSEADRYVSYYNEMLSDMMENGMSEDAAIQKIGTPEAIAEAILKDAAKDEFRKKDIVGRCLIVASTVLLILTLLFSWKSHFPYSVSLIGGADGPTSIFIAGKAGSFPGLYILTAALICITIVYKLFHRSR